MKKLLTIAITVLLVVAILGTSVVCNYHQEVRIKREIEGKGFSKGHFAAIICDYSSKYHEDKGQWPDVDWLMFNSGLRTTNRIEHENFKIIILDKPYQDTPDSLNAAETFAVSFHFEPADSSYYIQCRINSYYGGNPLYSTRGEGELASVWSMQMTMEKSLTDFFNGVQSNKGPERLEKQIRKYSEEISQISPTDKPGAQEALREYASRTLREFYFLVRGFEPHSEQFQEGLNIYSRQLGDYLFHQDWKTSDK